MKDPLSLNLYAYCQGNPIKYVDPSGYEVGMGGFKESGGGACGRITPEAAGKANGAGVNKFSIRGTWASIKVSFKSNSSIQGRYKFIMSTQSRSITNATIKAKPSQLHHFATNKSKTYTAQFKNIADKYGLNLDDAWNKKYMLHQGRHPNAYHDYVLNEMKKFDSIANGDKVKFLKLFGQLKLEITKNPEMLTKIYWY